VPGTVTGPIPSSDGKAMQTILQVNLGTNLDSREAGVSSGFSAVGR
jgi:hypothetical protein